MTKPNLVLGTTNSVPVGTTDAEIETIYQESFKPLLRSLYKNEKIPFTLHYTGHLLKWLERHHSEYIDVLVEMVQRKQIELLGGGFYDAILALIPRPDRIGQVESMTTLLRKRFRRRARGVWITGGVWEASLPGTLKTCGIDYAFVDDRLFRDSGLSDADLNRPRLTEDQGKTLIIFPVCGELDSISRDGKPEDAVEFIRKRSKGPQTFLTMIQDGCVYREGSGRPRPGEVRVSWLENFLDLLTASESVQISLPYRLLRTYQPRERIYFPSGIEHLRMLTTSVERNLLYSKMQYTHVLVNQIRGDRYRRQAAREELWKGQSHSAYWADGEMGIMNNRLRKEAYRSLIEAEKSTRERGIFSPAVVMIDFDMDGINEYLYQGQSFNAYIHQRGAQVFELDNLSSPWNYLDTIGATKDSSASRNAFVDHIMDPELELDDFASGKTGDLADFPSLDYQTDEVRREGKKLEFHATSDVQGVPVRLDKRYSFKKNAITVGCTILNNGERELNAVFASEINLSFLSQDADALRVFLDLPRNSKKEISPSVGSYSRVKSIRLEDLVNQSVVTVATGGCDELWVMPVEASYGGLPAKEKVYQGTRMLSRWHLKMDPGQSTDYSITLSLD